MSKPRKKSRGKKRKQWRPQYRPLSSIDPKDILTSGPPRTVPDPDPKRPPVPEGEQP